MGLRMIVVMMLFSSPSVAVDKRIECLSRIAYAESRGTAVDGLVAVMHASIRHADILKKHVCSIKAKQMKIPSNLREVYRVIAKGVMSGSIPDLSRGADSWSSGIPHRGKITRNIGGNIFSISLR